ncbi:hypothetical protein EU805_09070 [Salipiger sp. IMCC34102]|uniref:hypothetical protein n=1 Tax=Salipiger sp. IMCC34102 TaxID=2510647 RepID=UPI00101D6B88|nr:hypothetical protein [Salipiger sp. IMCC34102]RYH02746.1 hypothetical protein EU805_09070 [Salipiger sp. IMCC34102]
MKPNQKLPTLAVCDVLNIDRQRLNEDIASGAYPCAPRAHARTGRFWDEADMCALRVYSFMMNVYGVEQATRKPAISKRVAGMYAEAVLAALRADPDATGRFDFPLDGFNDGCVARAEGDAPSFWGPNDTGSEVATICFSIDGIRQQVRARYKQWAGEE